MSKIFTMVQPALLAIDAIVTRMILRFWIATLRAQRRQSAAPQH
jgi:hypothetical protein